MIYTGSFGEFRRQDLPLGICIAGRAPAWAGRGRWKDRLRFYPALAPKTRFVRTEDGLGEKWRRFVERYQLEVLSLLSPWQVLSDLRVMSAPHRVVLLCWEKDDLQCHRLIAGRWLWEKTGEGLAELGRSKYTE
jgi:uncharacterized protein YeaO (DUF488 family)